MNLQRKTLKNPFSFSGKGLHTGKNVSVKVSPDFLCEGIFFERKDLKNYPKIPAKIDLASQTSQKQTVLEKNNLKILTPEHLLAALFASGITDAKIQLSGEEIPILDGSAKFFLEKITTLELNKTFKPLKIHKTLEVYEKDSFLKITPSQTFSIKISANFHELGFFQDTFTLNDFEKIAQARTFCYLSEIEFLLNCGLIKGGNLGSAFVIVDCEPSKFLIEAFGKNYPKILTLKKGEILSEEGGNFRVPKEPLLHKVLDLLGDFSLLQTFVSGKVEAYQPSHKLNHKFLKMLLTQNT
ncbi:UDP-3-O-acyl-N-acetylglucosamine deacetylase [bacterium]|nr:UDP-3-O-acyl-N-acetylglucosamine deacetylase [bacterium]